ncbi:hypothetical protein [Neptuniibacter sp. QD37_11]|uniref:hypothetical protein n=1 Tax=Neptuniibacter sp. QD37_11 TaxID=3398209 RepID=UPI0039F44ADF
MSFASNYPRLYQSIYSLQKATRDIDALKEVIEDIVDDPNFNYSRFSDPQICISLTDKHVFIRDKMSRSAAISHMRSTSSAHEGYTPITVALKDFMHFSSGSLSEGVEVQLDTKGMANTLSSMCKNIAKNHLNELVAHLESFQFEDADYMSKISGLDPVAPRFGDTGISFVSKSSKTGDWEAFRYQLGMIFTESGKIDGIALGTPHLESMSTEAINEANKDGDLIKDISNFNYDSFRFNVLERDFGINSSAHSTIIGDSPAKTMNAMVLTLRTQMGTYFNHALKTGEDKFNLVETFTGKTLTDYMESTPVEQQLEGLVDTYINKHALQQNMEKEEDLKLSA